MVSAAALAASTAGGEPAGRVATVPCFAAIDHVPSGTQGGYRVVLGAASVPPLGLWGNGPVATGERPWRYWQKAGLLVHMGSPPVTVSVPAAWRDRLAITWGGSGVVPALRIGHCPMAAGAWSAYAGGFYVRSPGCVPLDVRIGTRATTAWFAVGRSCGPAPSGHLAALGPVRDCTRAEVRRTVRSFVQAFDRGWLARLDSLFAPADRFQWYSTGAPGRRLGDAARDRSTLTRYFADRHAAGERLELTRVTGGGNAHGYADFHVWLKRSARDLPPTRYEAKGAAICSDSGDAIAVWSMGP